MTRPRSPDLGLVMTDLGLGLLTSASISLIYSSLLVIWGSKTCETRSGHDRVEDVRDEVMTESRMSETRSCTGRGVTETRVPARCTRVPMPGYTVLRHVTSGYTGTRQCGHAGREPSRHGRAPAWTPVLGLTTSYSSMLRTSSRFHLDSVHNLIQTVNQGQPPGLAHRAI